jgi:hypothetical protein
MILAAELLADLAVVRAAEPLARVSDAEPAATAVSVLGTTEGFNGLAESHHVRAVSARDINQVQLEVIARMQGLQSLDIYMFRGGDLSPLGAVRELRHLSLAYAPKTPSLSLLPRASSLVSLALGDLLHIDDFQVLSEFGSLTSLSISGSVSKRQPVRTLAPIAALTQLRELALDGVSIGDGTLAPLTRLAGLRTLQLPRGLPVREYARVAAALPQVDCKEFQPCDVVRHLRYDEQLNKMVVDTSLPDLVLTAKPIKLLRSADPETSGLVEERRRTFEAWRIYYGSVPDPGNDTVLKLPVKSAPRPSRKPARK